MSIAGEPKSIKNLRSGDLLIQCTKQPHEANLLKMKTFCGLKCTVTPHKSLNTSKGIVHCPALSKQSCEHILEFMGEQGVTDVCRINVHRDGGLKPTNTFVFTFDSPVLPANVKIGLFRQKLTCISQIHLDVINVKCLATMKISGTYKRYASTAVCLNIANLVSV